MPKPYTPPRDSLAAQVCGYFQNNPDEELGLEDIVEKFSLKNHARVHTDLSEAWRADLIRRDVRDGDVIYTAGNLEFTAKATARKPARKTGSGKPAPKPANPAPATVVDFPDPVAVPLEDNVPCTSARIRRADWTLLLNRMQVNQSAKLPWHCFATLSKTITELHKQNTVKFVTKKYTDTQELRVWRVA